MSNLSGGQPDSHLANSLNYSVEEPYTRVTLAEGRMQGREIAIYSEEDDALIVNNQVKATSYNSEDITGYLERVFDSDVSNFVDPSKIDSVSLEVLFELFVSEDSEDVKVDKKAEILDHQGVEPTSRTRYNGEV